MSTVGLFGKTPAARDFVRVNIGTPTVRAFDDWLRESVMTLPSLRAHLSPEPLRFIFRAPGNAGHLVGVMKGSQDGVGREFPLAIFHHFDATALNPYWPGIPRGYGPFFSGAVEILEAMDRIDLASLPDLLERIPVPEVAAIQHSLQTSGQALAQISADEILDRLFSRPTGNPEGDRWPDDHFYGIGTLLNGCYRSAGRPPNGPAITLDCPVTSDSEMVFWLELARRILRWPSPPSMIWSQWQYRLLLVLGSPGPKLLGILGTPGTFDEQIWNLIADDEDIAARGPRLLTDYQRDAIDRPGQNGLMLLDGIAPNR